jgi:hypothetical protein
MNLIEPTTVAWLAANAPHTYAYLKVLPNISLAYFCSFSTEKTPFISQCF